MTHQNVQRDLIFHFIEFKIDSDTKKHDYTSLSVPFTLYDIGFTNTFSFKI